ncbi:hypothetical protein D6851_02620 [Altericroceibacterium spongiae]|uniref:Baseplate structural protein Gp9/Gp10 N-terminal domain-containing protein n=1 Tax=Altericroceibacterium spongiae TaxID=2320269 RepID=A0A420ERP9_9SPHN|nr:hypothetical protein [Altericroceibacterium spongiae]RKF23384.1 hypothetical protein D6851_02620 [Altericroceibacterium spongiae]
MARQIIDTGSVANDGTGDPLRDAMDKANANFSELYADIVSLNSVKQTASASAPASATAPGTAGQIAHDADYFYVCTAANTWKRVALATW